MDKLADFPFVALKLDKDGDLMGAKPALVPAGTTDLIVISHGWKNDAVDATALYRELLANVRQEAGTELGPRKFAVVGVYWPAFRFEPDLSIVEDDAAASAAGGAAGLDGDALISNEDLHRLATEVGTELGIADPTQLQAFADGAVRAKGGGGAADAFVGDLRKRLSPATADMDGAEHASLLNDPGEGLVAILGQGASFEAARSVGQSDGGDGPGGAAGLGDRIAAVGSRMISGGKAAIASLLNQATYFEMKARAGKVGEAVARMLEAEPDRSVRLHLIGHSFGARLVTSAAAKLPAGSVTSLTLLQGAYSHNGLGLDIGEDKVRGGFRDVVERKVVSGPITITHTHRDSAVGFFYAVASFVSGEVAKGIGDVVRRIVGGPKDLHGGIGANGAQSLQDGEAVRHVAGGGPLQLRPGRVNNVLADAIVQEHWDVRNAGIAAIVWSAMR